MEGSRGFLSIRSLLIDWHRLSRGCVRGVVEHERHMIVVSEDDVIRLGVRHAGGSQREAADAPQYSHIPSVADHATSEVPAFR